MVYHYHCLSWLSTGIASRAEWKHIGVLCAEGVPQIQSVTMLPQKLQVRDNLHAVNQTSVCLVKIKKTTLLSTWDLVLCLLELL